MEKLQLQNKPMVTHPEDLAGIVDVFHDMEEIVQVHEEFPLRIPSYYLGLIKHKDDPIWKQSVPDPRELEDTGFDDPLGEEHDSPVPHLTHRYPDRVLFYVSSICAMYCRFCTRKRKVGNPRQIQLDELEAGFNYIAEHTEIRDVVISGGDPLMHSDSHLETILKRLRSIPHVEIIRIGTRVPVVLPSRVTEKLCNMLKQYHPLYINTHFNHPNEITPESKASCGMLANVGIPLGNQTVLLKGVNDTPEVMTELMQKLLTIRVKPYYIYQMDLVKGTDHFRTSVQTGLDIMKNLRGHTSGLAVPHYVIDAPHGGGKIALIPSPIEEVTDKDIVLRNFEGNNYTYPNLSDCDCFTKVNACSC